MIFPYKISHKIFGDKRGFSFLPFREMIYQRVLVLLGKENFEWQLISKKYKSK